MVSLYYECDSSSLNEVVHFVLIFPIIDSHVLCDFFLALNSIVGAIQRRHLKPLELSLVCDATDGVTSICPANADKIKLKAPR